MDWLELVAPYNPWNRPGDGAGWRDLVPGFHRPVFEQIADEAASIDQYLSIIGPRRIGKSTLLKQLVARLLDNGVPADRIVYYSFDDPALLRAGVDGASFLDGVMAHLCDGEGPAYLLLDEIQTLDRWELYLKKFHDLKYPVKILISGSASSPIFKKSRESLLGRIRDHHLLPFSFRELMLHDAWTDPLLTREIETIHAAGDLLRGFVLGAPDQRRLQEVQIPEPSDALWTFAENALQRFFVEGGFPEVWKLPSASLKIDYLFDNQVQKVIYEDLVLASEFRKPEQLKRFYVSLLGFPGEEVNRAKLGKELQIPVAQIDKYLPLLEMTDLIRHADKFRKSAIRQRRGNQKFYLVDLALRNAVLRLHDVVLNDPAMLGLYAENLVFNGLKKWRGVLGVDFYRENNREVDFIVHTAPDAYLPIEVKYRERVKETDLKTLRSFHAAHRCSGPPVVVTKKRSDSGLRPDGVFAIPLILFLILMD